MESVEKRCSWRYEHSVSYFGTLAYVYIRMEFHVVAYFQVSFKLVITTNLSMIPYFRKRSYGGVVADEAVFPDFDIFIDIAMG